MVLALYKVSWHHVSFLTLLIARDKKKLAKIAKKKQIKKPRRKKEVAKKELENVNEKYIAIDKDLYCLGCKVFIKETIAELRGKQLESDVMEVMGYICQMQDYGSSYNYPPGEINRGCGVFAGDWEEELEQWLMKRDKSIPID